MNKLKITFTVAAVLGLSLLSSKVNAQGCNTLRQDVYTIDRIANQMVAQFSREMHCGCRSSVDLLNYLKQNALLTRNLVSASNGSCACTFKKAAAAVDQNMGYVASKARRVNLSCSMNSSIVESINLADRIDRNSYLFSPQTSYSNHSHSRPATQPVYGRPVSHGHGHSSQDPLTSLLSRLFR